MVKGPFSGACRCRKIQFRVEGSARYVSNCHCIDCQKSSGSAFMTWVLFRRQYFKLLKGELKTYSQVMGTERAFCPGCGSPVYWLSDRLPAWIDISLPLFNDHQRLQPMAEAWLSSKMHWVMINDRLEKFDQNPG